MKKLLLSIVLSSAVAIAANAQVSEGNIMAGGELTDLNIVLDNDPGFSFTLTPKAAWFIKEGTALGGYARLGIINLGNTIVAFGAGPLARYYILDEDLNVLKKTKFFGEVYAGIEGQCGHGSSTFGLGLGFGPGITYFLTPDIGLDALLTYNGVLGFVGDKAYYNNLNLSIGVHIYLPYKKIIKTIQEN